MSIYDKSIKNVAEVAAKIMGEALKGNQHKIDANKNNKIDAHDFKLLRAGKKPGQVKESGEMGPVKDTMGAVLMRHKTSGREINVTNSPEVVKQHQARGYEKVSTVKKEETAAEETDSVNEVYGDPFRRRRKEYDEGPVRGPGGKISRIPDSVIQRMDAARNKAEKEEKEKREREQQKTEEVELQEMSNMIDALIQEYESKGGTYRHKGTYGYGGKGPEHGQTDYKKENDLSKATEKPAKKKYGARQNYVRATRVNESFSELLQKYTEGGVKSLNESMYVLQEEADNDQFTAELEKAKRKQAGQDRNDKAIAAGATQSVKSVSENVEQIDENLPITSLKPGHDEKAARFLARQVKGTLVKGKAQSAPQKEGGMKKKVKEEVEQVDERTMTEPEMKERERIVKGMKKGLSGFKQRYGERAKSVMYATATKTAMKD